MTQNPNTFRNRIQDSYQNLLTVQEKTIPGNERLKIDLHCHDENSDIPDELWGRILKIPETWIKTTDLVRSLKRNDCDVVTITNHNNARSCWQLLDRGEDVLVGAEFSCCFKEYDLNLHVLTYGFSPAEEVKLNKYRHNLYRFLTYAAEHDLPTVLPHPLYFYTPKSHPGAVLLEKLALLFERFEVANGQRDIWQNLLVWEWLNSLTEETIDEWRKKHQLDPGNFCKHPYQKRCTGGSDDHMGIFAGTCGSYLHVPDLPSRLQKEKPSDIALDALKNGLISPFGHVGNHEKLNVSLLDYLSQMTFNMKEPGLLRMFMHQGSLKDKLFCLGISNIIQELKRHKFTIYFFKTLHDALNGKRPGFFGRFRISSDFKPMMLKIDEIARSYHSDHETYLRTLGSGIPEIFGQLTGVIAKRIKGNPEWVEAFDAEFELDTRSLIERFEIPTHFRNLFEDNPGRQTDHVTQVNVSRFFDQLSFPVLASTIMAGSSLLSAGSLNANRSFLNEFAESLGQHRHPEKVLWLTDTLNDKNGVSASLSAKLKVVQENNLPIDFLVCSNDITEQSHLRVVKSVGRFSFPNYRQQTIHIPNILEVKQLFLEGGYDRIVCSTEFAMGPVALYLKASFKVPAYFFLHTDWLEFIRDTTQLDPSVVDRIRRMLRVFYRGFDGLFVLNRDHRDWLTGREIQIPKERVFLTSHWVSEVFYPRARQTEEVFQHRVQENDFVLLYAGRISEEKGVMELPIIFRQLKERLPNARLVIAGVGPAEKKLRQLIPEAIFLGWVPKQEMPRLYASSSLLVLPSRFDTFGNVLLEAMRCGLPVAAYQVKGPKDIIKNAKYGILANDLNEMAEKIASVAVRPNQMNAIKVQALQRARSFSVQKIMQQLLTDLNFKDLFVIKTPGNHVRTPSQQFSTEPGKMKEAG